MFDVVSSTSIFSPSSCIFINISNDDWRLLFLSLYLLEFVSFELISFLRLFWKHAFCFFLFFAIDKIFTSVLDVQFSKRRFSCCNCAVLSFLIVYSSVPSQRMREFQQLNTRRCGAPRRESWHVRIGEFSSPETRDTRRSATHARVSAFETSGQWPVSERSVEPLTSGTFNICNL